MLSRALAALVTASGSGPRGSSSLGLRSSLVTTTLGPLEAETCRDYVVIRLLDAGWSQDQIIEHVTPSHGCLDPA